MNLSLGLYDGPPMYGNGVLLEEWTTVATNVRLSTYQHGYLYADFFVPLTLYDVFRLYEMSTNLHVGVHWLGTPVWEGTLRDVKASFTPTRNGLQVRAYGYSLYYSDTLYNATHLNANGQTIAQAVVASVASKNTNVSNSTVLIANPNVTISEEYQDRRASDVLDRVVALSSTTTSLWQWGVYNWQTLWLQPYGALSNTYYIDITAINTERTASNLYNSVYIVYQGASNERKVTSTSTDALSVARYNGLTRELAQNIQTNYPTVATAMLAAYLADYKTPPPEASYVFDRLYDHNGNPYPLHVLRSGDVLVVRNLFTELSETADRVRNLYVKETVYTPENNKVDVVLEVPPLL